VKPAHLLALLSLSFALPLTAQPGPRPGIVRVRIETSAGNFTLGLEAKRAPATTKNFLAYVDDGRLNGADIYRVARARKAPHVGFVQGGIRSDATRILPPFPLETTRMTGIKHLDGTISMARRAGPDSAGGNFFITVGPNPAMDWSPQFPGYGAFGHVIDNMPLVRRILAMPTSARMNGTMLAQPIKIIRAVRLDGKAQPTGRIETWKIMPKRQ
jgi:peptidyl-prolyl cis-trans isomerase A (cyclophilin A)